MVENMPGSPTMGPLRAAPSSFRMVDGKMAFSNGTDPEFVCDEVRVFFPRPGEKFLLNTKTGKFTTTEYSSIGEDDSVWEPDPDQCVVMGTRGDPPGVVVFGMNIEDLKRFPTTSGLPI